MNIELIKHLAKEKGISITKLESICGFGNGTIGKWVKQSPSCDNLYKVAKYLDVTIDCLYLGKNKNSTPDLTDIEQRMLEVFNWLTPEDQIYFIGRIEQRVEDYTPEQKEEQLS